MREWPGNLQGPPARGSQGPVLPRCGPEPSGTEKGEGKGRGRGCKVEPLGAPSQDSTFSFFLLFFRNEGVLNFFFFFEGDLEGEPSGDMGPLVTDSVLSFEVSTSVSPWVVIWPRPLLRTSSADGSSSLPFTTTPSGCAVSGSEVSLLVSVVLAPSRKRSK